MSVFDLKISGNILTINNIEHGEAMMYVLDNEVEQYVLLQNQTNNLYSLSFPMRKREHEKYKAVIHRHNNENKLGKKLDTGNGKPDNDPTPPGRGGCAKVTEFVNTQAIAA